jgi:hypothetical protein
MTSPSLDREVFEPRGMHPADVEGVSKFRQAAGALLIALCSTVPVTRAEDPNPSGRSSLPNLKPQSPSTAPLLRKINNGPATMIPSFYCAGISADQEVEVQVPPFDWGVANDDRSAVQEPFSVSLLGGSTRASLATQTVSIIPESGTRIFRNWPGRATRVKVIKLTRENPRLAAEYEGTPGCYIPTALAGKITLDPKPLIIRVDDGGRIAERVETDNDLTR